MPLVVVAERWISETEAPHVRGSLVGSWECDDYETALSGLMAPGYGVLLVDQSRDLSAQTDQEMAAPIAPRTGSVEAKKSQTHNHGATQSASS